MLDYERVQQLPGGGIDVVLPCACLGCNELINHEVNVLSTTDDMQNHKERTEYRLQNNLYTNNVL